jgi:rhamnosyltransferase subunit B
MSRIVLTTIGSFGDLHPKIAIGLELRQRGHDVVFATHPEYGDKIVALGFEFQPMRPNLTALNDPQEMARMMDLKTGTKYLIKDWLCANLRETYADLSEGAKDADLIITGEGVLVARSVAEKLEIPWVSAVLQPASFLSVYDPSVLPVLPMLAKLRGLGAIANRGVVQLTKIMSKPWLEPVHQLRRELGLPALAGNPLIDDKYSPHLVLAMFSPAFAQPQPDWPAHTVQTGFTFYDGNSEGGKLPPQLQQFLESGEPPIVFTLGSAAVASPGNFYAESIQAAQLLNRRAVLLMGQNSPPETLSTEMIAVSYVPYSEIFPHASAIVHQGGVGTTGQALRAGHPTLVMPYSHDQPDNAARVARLGTSRTLTRSQYLAPRVAQELRQVLETPSYAAQAATMGQRIQAENGAQVACDAIENLLHS